MVCIKFLSFPVGMLTVWHVDWFSHVTYPHLHVIILKPTNILFIGNEQKAYRTVAIIFLLIV